MGGGDGAHQSVFTCPAVRCATSAAPARAQTVTAGPAIPAVRRGGAIGLSAGVGVAAAPAVAARGRRFATVGALSAGAADGQRVAVRRAPLPGIVHQRATATADDGGRTALATSPGRALAARTITARTAFSSGIAAATGAVAVLIIRCRNRLAAEVTVRRSAAPGVARSAISAGCPGVAARSAAQWTTVAAACVRIAATAGVGFRIAARYAAASQCRSRAARSSDCLGRLAAGRTDRQRAAARATDGCGGAADGAGECEWAAGGTEVGATRQSQRPGRATVTADGCR